MTVYNSYPPGSLVRVDVTFTNSGGTPTDPSAITLEIRTPAGTNTTLVYGVDLGLVRDSAGVYHSDIQADLEGTWHYRFEGTGNVRAANDGRFYITDSVFV